ncbi:MAG: alpha/beta fold hydrolase [Pelagimonas sp.]|jgi:pimeloyl-ACP methyl ester carboxylesterase/DNA-binding CsgD family transcriptional regulator|nr:alpha/beta fold hydrolase [Pelagimonas sp.]
MTQPDDPSLKLIETIYRAALDPTDYDSFMGQWHDWIVTRMHELDDVRLSDPAMSAPEVVAHFELAMRLLDQLGDQPSGPQIHGPQVLFDTQQRVLWQNAEADRLLGKTKQVFDLPLSEPHRILLEDFLISLARTGHADPIAVQIAPQTGGRPQAFRLAQMHGGSDGPLALLSSLAPPWPIAANTLLQDTHGLSDGECAICALLFGGLPPAEIAERRNTSVATVRTQVKKILSKTQASSQSELIAYLHSMIRLAETLPPPSTATALPAPKDGRLHELTHNGRRLIVEEHGPKTGHPILFVHGMLDGTGITPATSDLLYRHKLRLICPHRPAFGRSEPLVGHVAEALQETSDILRMITQQWGLQKPVMLGHMAGALYAYAGAQACDACGIVVVAGGVPITSPSQFDSMTRRQRLVAYTARYAPSVLPFVLNAGIRQIRSGGIEKFMHSLYEHAPVDWDVLQDDAVRAQIHSGYQFSIAQGHKGFAADSYHVVRDWSDMLCASDPIPVRLVHGAHDPVVDPKSVKAFAQRYPDRIHLTMCPDAGQLVFYQSPEYVLNEVLALLP